MTIPIKAIRAALEAATPGTWYSAPGALPPGWAIECTPDPDGEPGPALLAWGMTKEDALLVHALARAAPALLSAAEETERLRAELDEAREQRAVLAHIWRIIDEGPGMQSSPPQFELDERWPGWRQWCEDR